MPSFQTYLKVLVINDTRIMNGVHQTSLNLKPLSLSSMTDETLFFVRKVNDLYYSEEKF